MEKRNRNKALVFLMAAFLLGLSVFCWVKPADEVSDSERRGLKQFPELKLETLIDGSFAKNFETYALDQFPLRDTFRGIKSMTAAQLFQQKDVNDLYTHEGHIVSIEYPLQMNALDWAASRFDNLNEMYFKDTNAKIYLAIIPDKNYFLAEESGHLSMDYESFVEEMATKVPYMKYIDLMGGLTANNYYRTDSHWNQTALIDVAETLADAMGADIDARYEPITLEEPFYGVYYGQLARPMEVDELSYLTNETLSQCTVFDYQNNREMPMYDLAKVSGKDPYELFLGGPLSLVTIDNPAAKADKELIVFRDSFASSIAPLLVEGYKKITLVDIRYIQPAMLEKYMTFDAQDVLFLYSTSVLNNSSTLK